MSMQLINIGAAANDGTGDTLRNAAIKINENFQEIYQLTGITSSYNTITMSNLTPLPEPINININTGTSVFRPAIAGQSDGNKTAELDDSTYYMKRKTIINIYPDDVTVSFTTFANGTTLTIKQYGMVELVWMDAWYINSPKIYTSSDNALWYVT